LFFDVRDGTRMDRDRRSRVPFEYGRVAALRQRDEDRLIARFRVELAQFIPNAPGVGAHNRVVVIW
jgi:hypothetical protein